MAKVIKRAAKKVATAEPAIETASKKDGRGRVSSYKGKKIFRLTKEVNFRPDSDRMQSWKAINRDGMTVDTYRNNSPAGFGMARRHLASFIEAGLVELRD